MHASRALVPLDYTDGDRFSHDPALPQSAWPALDPLRALSQAKPGSDQARFAAVGARRAANRVLHALKDAQAALGAGTCFLIRNSTSRQCHVASRSLRRRRRCS